MRIEVASASAVDEIRSNRVSRTCRGTFSMCIAAGSPREKYETSSIVVQQECRTK